MCIRDSSHLGVGRIDHGRCAFEDEHVVRDLVERETMLTLCPISNVVLKGVARVEDMPIRKCLDAGVRFSVNSDDPAYFGGYVLENFCAIQDAFGLTVDEWSIVTRGAIEGSWCEKERKRELLVLLDNVVEAWI